MKQILITVWALFVFVGVSFAQGEYTGYGQSGFGFGYAHGVGRESRLTSITAGICSNGKSDVAVSVVFDNRSRTTEKVWGFGVRSFFKKKADRQTVFGSLDLSLAAGDNAVFTLGGTGYGNLWTGKAGYFQLRVGEHLMFNPQGVGRGSTFHFLTVFGASYLVPLSTHLSLSFEGGFSIIHREETRGNNTSGAVGAALIFPLSKSSAGRDSW